MKRVFLTGKFLAVALVMIAVFCFGQSESIIRTTEDWPTYIDPAVGSDFSDCIAIVNLYDSLVFPNADGSVRPHLATHWDVSPDGLTWTFYLRQGVKFHSGNELTAEDVVFSVERMLTMGEGFAYMFEPFIDEVVALDSYTVQFKMKKPYGPFLSTLVRLYILEKDLVLQHLDSGPYGEFGDYGRKWLLEHDAGSGPYMVEEVKMEEYVLMKKFDDWWGGWEPNAPEYFKEMATADPVTIRTLVAKKELEITDEIQPMESYEAMAKMPGVEVIRFVPGGMNLNLMLHTRKPPTDDVHFRRALAYAVDYKTIANIIFPGSLVARGPVPQTLPGHDSSIQPWEFNLDKAREELKKSKYYGQLDKYPLTLSWCAEVPEEEKIALMLQANFAKIGVKLEITKKPFGSMIADAQNMETTPNCSLIFVAAHYMEAGGMLTTRYHSQSTGTWEQCEWLLNPEIDRMIEDALSTIDTEERFSKYHAIQQKLVELCPTIWLIDRAETRAYQASYISWFVADLVHQGKKVSLPLGYGLYAHDMKVFPEKK